MERAPGASVFHHPAWLELLRASYGYEMSACCVVDDDGTIVAGLPLARIRSRLTASRMVSLPFSDVCPPLRLRADGEVDELLAACADAERRRGRVRLEVRAPFRGLRDGVVEPVYYHHRIRLGPDPDRVEANFAKSQTTRGVARAVREGLTVDRTTGTAGIEAFYRLHVQTRRRQGVPVQPSRFIRSFAELFEQGLGFVMLTKLGDRAIAAAVFLNLHRTLTYKYGASDARFLPKRPNNLLFAEAIRWGCLGGFETLDLGRTDLENQGLRSFKRAWGAEEATLSYTYAPARPARAGWPLARRAARSVIRRGPPWVGRLTGELLYRHFG